MSVVMVRWDSSVCLCLLNTVVSEVCCSFVAAGRVHVARACPCMCVCVCAETHTPLCTCVSFTCVCPKHVCVLNMPVCVCMLCVVAVCVYMFSAARPQYKRGHRKTASYGTILDVPKIVVTGIAGPRAPLVNGELSVLCADMTLSCVSIQI